MGIAIGREQLSIGLNGRRPHFEHQDGVILHNRAAEALEHRQRGPFGVDLDELHRTIHQPVAADQWDAPLGLFLHPDVADIDQSVLVRRSTLEDVFLTLTGRTLVD